LERESERPFGERERHFGERERPFGEREKRKLQWATLARGLLVVDVVVVGAEAVIAPGE
jgi:hypothetical protein